ncbi:MAG TPA: primosomal protein N', partial [Halanaerobiales bacterium]|nr:primosomal protein N' [Halanaerobiales bacterium]
LKVIKTAIPAGLLKGTIKKKVINHIITAKPDQEIKKYILKHGNRANKQKMVLEYIIKNKGSYTVSELAAITETSKSVIYHLVQKGFLRYQEKVTERRPDLADDIENQRPQKLTADQNKVINCIIKNIKNRENKPFLLHDVTGSGKTEIYLQAIKYILNKKQGAIVLVPEISLTPVMIRRFYSRFGDEIAVLHSNLSLGERYDEWRRIKSGKARIAIGARSAIFAPVKEPGLIIIDEEHENTYKQSEYPHYHAREVALKRAKISGISIILGSATPSLESFYYARTGIFSYLNLPERINKEKLPPVKIVDMREEIKKGNTSIFSNDLLTAIRNALNNGEQILIFLNRRGYANFMLCRECGFVIKCLNCDISLTYHSSNNKLRCHYCDYSLEVPEVCPECDSKYIREFGMGTEKIEQELNNIFPEANLERMDVDTTGSKGAHREILNRLENGAIDILVGTQMIAKGHDYPNISVVGVITADTILNIPDFRSSERTFQLLTQVAGRTGRGKKDGRVIIQTYTPEHYSIQAAQNHNYLKFYKKEIKMRKRLDYPPFTQMVNIIISGKEEKAVSSAAALLGMFFDKYNKYINEKLGPAPAPISRLRNKYRWQIILKFKGWKKRNQILNRLKYNSLGELENKVSINIDVDPLTML